MLLQSIIFFFLILIKGFVVQTHVKYSLHSHSIFFVSYRLLTVLLSINMVWWFCWQIYKRSYQSSQCHWQTPTTLQDTSGRKKKVILEAIKDMDTDYITCYPFQISHKLKHMDTIWYVNHCYLNCNPNNSDHKNLEFITNLLNPNLLGNSLEIHMFSRLVLMHRQT